MAEQLEGGFIAAMRRIPAQVEQLAEAIIAGDDGSAIARCASALEGCRAELALVVERLKKALPALLGEKETEVEGLGVVTVRADKSRRAWQKPELLRIVTAVIADEGELWADPESGEILPRHEQARRILERFGQFFGLAAPKTTGLKSIGVDPDEYSEATFKGWTVQLPSRRPPEFGDTLEES